MISADELAASGLRGKLKMHQRICKDRGKSVSASVLEVINFSREVMETRPDNAKLLDRTSDLALELVESRTSKRLACDRTQKTEACVKVLELHVAPSKSKYSKTIEKSAQL